MRAWRGNILGSPNIGMYIYVTDEFGLISPYIKEKIVKELERTFGVKFYRVTVCGTDLVGIFIAGKDDKLLVPDTIRDSEVESLRDVAEVYVIKTRFNALGNNMLIGDNAILVNPDLEKEAKKQVSKIFSLPLYDLTIGKSKTVGSLVVCKKDSVLVPPIIKNSELDRIKRILNPKILNIGSVNFGSPFLRAGLVVNSYGYAVGELTTGHELALIDETFSH